MSDALYNKLAQAVMDGEPEDAEALREADIRERVKVMVGEALVIQGFAGQIGADGFAEDAISVLDLAFRFFDYL